MKKIIIATTFFFAYNSVISQPLNPLLKLFYDTTFYVTDSSYTVRSNKGIDYSLLFFRDKFTENFEPFTDDILTSPLTIVAVDSKTRKAVYQKKYDYNLLNGLYNDDKNIFISLSTYNMNPYYEGKVYRLNIVDNWFGIDEVFNFSTMSYYCFNKRNNSFLLLNANDRYDILIGNREKYKIIEYKSDSNNIYSTRILGVTKFKYVSPSPGGVNSAIAILKQIATKEPKMLDGIKISEYQEF